MQKGKENEKNFRNNNRWDCRHINYVLIIYSTFIMKRINSGKLSIVYIDGEKIKRLLINSYEFKTRKEIVKYLEQKWEIKINKENLKIKPFRILED